jgi:uncharacterized membrane protein YvbJ
MERSEWLCQHCGCENSAESSHCERCNAPATADETYNWSCQACGHDNPPGLTHCAVCKCPEVANDHEIADFQKALPIDPTKDRDDKTLTPSQRTVLYGIAAFVLMLVILVVMGVMAKSYFHPAG